MELSTTGTDQMELTQCLIAILITSSSIIKDNLNSNRSVNTPPPLGWTSVIYVKCGHCSKKRTSGINLGGC